MWLIGADNRGHFVTKAGAVPVCGYLYVGAKVWKVAEHVGHVRLCNECQRLLSEDATPTKKAMVVLKK